jgi:hypothetical protein
MAEAIVSAFTSELGSWAILGSIVIHPSLEADRLDFVSPAIGAVFSKIMLGFWRSLFRLFS